MRSETKTAEIAGVWLPNKGAELMAHTVIQELGHRLPALSFWSNAQGDAEVRASMGMPARKKERPSLMGRVLKLLKGLDPDEKVMIDISGFAYGDHWGVEKARQRAGKAVRRKRATYLLPQAFGPFTDTALAAEMRKILAGARSVAARDKVSLGHLQLLGVKQEIQLLPDITVSLDVSAHHPEVPSAPYGCLVLNRKSLEGGHLDETALLSLYEAVADLYRAHGLQPIIVLHEPTADRLISEKLATRCGLEMVEHADARDTKRFIAGAHCVVTGRFHGLVSGLSNGVPSFAVSWSHKYRELLSDYQCPDALFDRDREVFLDGIRRILAEPEQHAARRDMLLAIATEQKARLATYWDGLAADIAKPLD